MLQNEPHPLLDSLDPLARVGDHLVDLGRPLRPVKLTPEQRALLVEIITELEARAEEKEPEVRFLNDATPILSLIEVGRVLSRIIHKSDKGL